MGKVDRNKQIKQSALYNTAFELFTTKGISKTTISDIVEKAGVAKGTFYLYFKDKLDIRDKLVSHKTAELFQQAHAALLAQGITGFASSLHFIVDFMLDHLQANPPLVAFIYKNLSWGVFEGILNEKIALPESIEAKKADSFHFYDQYLAFLSEDISVSCEDPELLLFSILELVSGTCYSCIVYGQPVSLARYRPFLHRAIDGILAGCTVRQG